ncbi:MAG: hypothetical protein DWQ45_17710 [Planctomycetota bacterium]|nr:MAG: hypothetical protein DWQ29_03705 [Planctomycetota bacterium]REK32176.1 MAG: hypothetical protein DWQ45_17710 [Planctomycetota bacterium]
MGGWTRHPFHQNHTPAATSGVSGKPFQSPSRIRPERVDGPGPQSHPYGFRYPVVYKELLRNLLSFSSLHKSLEWNADDHGWDWYSLIVFLCVDAMRDSIEAASALPPLEEYPRIRADPPNP